MSPLSVLPGRIRFEVPRLLGKKNMCKCLTKCVNEMKGVTETCISHRTGRILIKFDERYIQRDSLTQHIEYTLAHIETTPLDDQNLMIKTDRKEKSPSGIINDALIEMIFHTILPKPLDFIFPIAIKVMRN